MLLISLTLLAKMMVMATMMVVKEFGEIECREQLMELPRLRTTSYTNSIKYFHESFQGF